MAAANNRAVKAEALGHGVTFEFDGETYEILPASEWDLDAIEAFEAQKAATGVRLILGDKQYKRFKSKPRKVADLTRLFEVMQAHIVGSQGN